MPIHILTFIVGFLLFMLGLRSLRSGLHYISAGRLVHLLQKATASPWKGAAAAAAVTAVLQSSSAVTASTITLVDAGAINFNRAVGIILGTNVGTCATVQFLSLESTIIPIPLVLFGILALLCRLKKAGEALISLGSVFAGLEMMALGASPLAESTLFINLMVNTMHPLKGVILGTISTALVQSSSAVMGVLVALSMKDMISIYSSVPIMLGSNLGTCITAVLAAFGSSRAGKQVAAAHVLLNLIGIAAFLPFVNSFASFCRLTADAPSAQLANAHLLFNVFSSLAVLPFSNRFARLVAFIIR